MFLQITFPKNFALQAYYCIKLNFSKSTNFLPEIGQPCTLKTRRKRRKKKISTNVQKFRNFLELILTQDQKLTFSISRIQIWVKVMGHRHVSTFDDLVPSTYPSPPPPNSSPKKDGGRAGGEEEGGEEGEIFHGRKKRPSFPSTRNQLVRASFFPRIRA